MQWIGVTDGSIITPTVDYTVDGWDYSNNVLEPEPNDPSNAGTHTLLRVVGSLYIWTPADGLSGLPNVANLPIAACILIAGERDRNNALNTSSGSVFVPTRALDLQDTNRIIWQRIHGAFDVDDGSGNGLAGTHNPPDPAIDSRVKRRIDFSRFGWGFQLAAPTGQLTGCRYSLTLRSLWAADGSMS